LIETNAHTSPGAGVGSTYTEYWYKNYKAIGPLKIIDSLNFNGTETQIMTDAPQQLPY
jgi:hypothetical protein